jgi:hypothetical protein
VTTHHTAGQPNHRSDEHDYATMADDYWVVRGFDDGVGYTGVGLSESYATVRRCLNVVELRKRGVRVAACEHPPLVMSTSRAPTRAHRGARC